MGRVVVESTHSNQYYYRRMWMSAWTLSQWLKMAKCREYSPNCALVCTVVRRLQYSFLHVCSMVVCFRNSVSEKSPKSSGRMARQAIIDLKSFGWRGHSNNRVGVEHSEKKELEKWRRGKTAALLSVLISGWRGGFDTYVRLRINYWNNICNDSLSRRAPHIRATVPYPTMLLRFSPSCLTVCNEEAGVGKQSTMTFWLFHSVQV
jgi:hypothetical protein